MQHNYMYLRLFEAKHPMLELLFWQKNYYKASLSSWRACRTSVPEVIKLFSCATQLSMKFFLLINVKMPTVVGILTCMSGKNNIPGLTEPKKAEFLGIFIVMSI